MAESIDKLAGAPDKLESCPERRISLPMGHGIEMEVCQGTGSGVGVRKTQEKMVCKVHRGVWKGVQVGTEPGGQVGQSGCTCMCKSWDGYPTHRKIGAARADKW